MQPTGQLDQKTRAALGVIGALAASPAMPAQNTTLPAPSTPPGGMAAGSAMDRTLGTDATGTDTTGTNATGTNATGTNPGANAPDGTPGNPPGTALGRATDRTLGTNATGANPGVAISGTNAAGGDTNQAVATTNANAPQPAHGANSFSMGEAQRRIADHGFQNVNGLHMDDGGVWRGTATKDGQQVNVWLDYKGDVGQQ